MQLIAIKIKPRAILVRGLILIGAMPWLEGRRMESVLKR